MTNIFSINLSIEEFDTFVGQICDFLQKDLAQRNIICTKNYGNLVTNIRPYVHNILNLFCNALICYFKIKC